MAPTPGWYVDPGGGPGLFRYWDGRAWSATTTPDPYVAGPTSGALSGAPVAGTATRVPAPAVPQSRRRPVGWILAAVAAVLVLVIAGALVVRGLGGGALGQDAGNPGASAGVVCPEATARNSTAASDTPDRVVSGRLSYPRLGAPFTAPFNDPRTPFGRDVRTQMATVETTSEGNWVAQVLIARLLAGDGFYGPQQGAGVVAQCVIGKFYWDYPVGREDVRNQAITVDGHGAWLIEMHLTFDIPDLETRGETATIVVIDTGDGEAGLFYSSIPDTSPQFTQPAADALAGLQVS